MVKSIAIILVAVATLIGAWGALHFKLGAQKLSRNIFANLKNKSLWIAVLFYGMSSLLFMIGLRMGDLSVIYPITSLTYVWIVFLSMKILKETMNFYKWLGIALVMIGVTIISLGV